MPRSAMVIEYLAMELNIGMSTAVILRTSELISELGMEPIVLTSRFVIFTTAVAMMMATSEAGTYLLSFLG